MDKISELELEIWMKDSNYFDWYEGRIHRYPAFRWDIYEDDFAIIAQEILNSSYEEACKSCKVMINMFANPMDGYR